jgi:hypothetical protein
MNYLTKLPRLGLDYISKILSNTVVLSTLLSFTIVASYSIFKKLKNRLKYKGRNHKPGISLMNQVVTKKFNNFLNWKIYSIINRKSYLNGLRIKEISSQFKKQVHPNKALYLIINRILILRKAHL